MRVESGPRRRTAFSVVAHILPRSCRLAVTGALDARTAPRLQAAAQRGGCRRPLVRLDLTHVSFLDSTAIRLLLELRRQAEAEGRRLVTTLPRATTPRRVLEIAGVAAALGAPRQPQV